MDIAGYSGLSDAFFEDPVLRSCGLSAVDRGFGTCGRERKTPFLGYDHFYDAWNLNGDIHESPDFSPRILLFLIGSYRWKSGIFS